VLTALAIDLGLFTRGRVGGAVSLRSATVRSIAWAVLSLLFGLVVLALYGRSAAVSYLTAYLLEKSLSIDNVFVFVLIFSELRIPPDRQRGVLLWGVIGALLMRGLLIASGLFILSRFRWVVYPFGALIIFAAIRLLWGRDKERELVVAACGVCTSWVARIVPITPVFHGNRFWIRQAGKFVATPLLVAVFIVETTDIVFALDSVPAVLAVTREPFIVYSSNIFAMLGLRSLYFVLAGIIDKFRYLRGGLAAILIFFGARLILSGVIQIPNMLSLAFIALAIGVAIAASLRWPDRGSHPSTLARS
jgi:tellurite resistance protein TerC